MLRFCGFFSQIEKKYALLHFRRWWHPSHPIVSQMAFHEPASTHVLAHMGIFQSLLVSKFFFSFSFWLLDHEVLTWIYMVSFLLMALFFFFKVKAKVLLQTSCLHPSVALPHEQTLPVCLFLLLLFSHCLVTHESIIPEKEEPPRFQAHRNNFSLEQCFWMTGCDF